MKQIILLMMLLMIAFASSADNVCRLSNAGETVRVKNYTVTDNHDQVVVDLLNDSNVNANITITVKVEYTGFYKETFSQTHLVVPGDNQYSVDIQDKIRISLSSYANYRRILSVDIDGYKCQH